jgi:hypothetical protein
MNRRHFIALLSVAAFSVNAAQPTFDTLASSTT